ncbi:MlaA family lipoprotein [Pseudodesulfovibrio piezophilus]|uniref:VacJ family lipoprotein n=1 Tax=Pseudodesulfovibrio piezophilus (strain DSM 21447 / JCM 15486 / C1TLV30) TaxID=1322246 RepID=M1WQI4_PSEP2|nr:VacJ family lipoprotein [Pseudodesulfovibrio piezophilus]CCH48974.1 VacJ family lipoprotein [Pseudodesulfovibrio piezophilus C1TLV30]
MNTRAFILIALAALLVLASGTAFAAEKTLPLKNATLLAQFSDMKGAGAAADAPDALSDEDIFAEEEYADSEELIADPLYGFNLVMFHFNDALYHGVFHPVAEGYAWAIPAKPRQWVRNFFVNILFPVRFVNNILQGKFDAAYMETSKFIANTTWGLLGFADVASTMKRNWEPERPTADGFGQTLGKTGLGHGFYIVWPFLGPSSVRETVGWVGDTYLDPLTYADFSFLELAGIRAYKNLNSLSLELEGNEYETLTEGAVDKYAAVRDAYIRFRAKKVKE